MALDIFASTASLFTLLLIAVERCCAIVYPFRHRALTKRIYMNGVAGAWLMAVLITVTRFLTAEVFFDSVIFVASTWIITSLAAMVVLAICCLYTLIWISSKKDDPRIPRDKREQNKRLSKTLFIVTASSVVTWLPFAVIFVLPHHIKSHGNCILRSAIFAGRFLQLANSFLNSVVYCYRMPEFSRVIRQYLFWCRKVKAVNIRSAQTYILTDMPVFDAVSNSNQHHSQ